MTLFTGLFIFRSEPDGTSVSKPELARLQRAERKAELLAPLKTAAECDSMQGDEVQREDRMLHIRARLRSAEGHAKADFTTAATGKAKPDFDRERLRRRRVTRIEICPNLLERNIFLAFIA